MPSSDPLPVRAGAVSEWLVAAAWSNLESWRVNANLSFREDAELVVLLRSVRKAYESRIASLEQQGGRDDWASIAEYVRTVADKAFTRGYYEASMELAATVDREAQVREARLYTGSGFDAATVQKHFPRAPVVSETSAAPQESTP